MFGVISDVNGEALPGVRITAIGEDGRSREAVTNPLGRFTIDSLPPGTYRIEARMRSFETRVRVLSVTPGGVADASGALLTAPDVFETPIEPRVMKQTGEDALDCGRRSSRAEGHQLEKSLACILDASKQRRAAAVVVQFVGHFNRGGYGLLTRADGSIHHFRFGYARLDFHLKPCASPRVVADTTLKLFVFACGEGDRELASDILVPDLAGWRRQRLPRLPDAPWISLAPDWVCEVLSPSTSTIDRTRKLPVYARAGVGYVWLVDPIAGTTEVLRRERKEWVTAAMFTSTDPLQAEPFGRGE